MEIPKIPIVAHALHIELLSSTRNHMTMRILLLTLAMVSVSSTLVAQGKPPVRSATRSTVVKRRGTAEEIATTRDAAIVVLTRRWSDGYQRATSPQPCELLLISQKTSGDLVTNDGQSVDVGLLGTSMDRVRDPSSGTDDLRLHTASGNAEVSRSRERILEGAPQPRRTEKVLFLALIGQRGNAGLDAAAEAVIGWSIHCEKVAGR